MQSEGLQCYAGTTPVILRSLNPELSLLSGSQIDLKAVLLHLPPHSHTHHGIYLDCFQMGIGEMVRAPEYFSGVAQAKIVHLCLFHP